MEKENKIVSYLKENYRLIIPIALMIVVFIAAIIYYKVTIFDNYTKDSEEKVYQWFYSQKTEYTGIVSKNRKNEIANFKAKDAEIRFDSTPVYYQEKDIVIFPSKMSVVMPTLNCAEYLANKYSYIEIKNENKMLVSEKYNNRLGHYFLYDGNDLYFFLDEVKITIKDTQITLSPLSFIIASSNNYLSYYDKKTDTYKTINKVNSNITVENSYYKINIMTDSIDYYGTNVILTAKIDELNPIKMKGN